MAIAELDMPLEYLTPIQANGVSLPHIDFLDTLGELDPASAVQLTNGLILLVDGTHRAYKSFLRGEEVTRTRLVVDDSDVRRLGAGSIWGCFSISDVESRYYNSWVPRLEDAGVTSIATLPTRTTGR